MDLVLKLYRVIKLDMIYPQDGDTYNLSKTQSTYILIGGRLFCASGLPGFGAKVSQVIDSRQAAQVWPCF